MALLAGLVTPALPAHAAADGGPEAGPEPVVVRLDAEASPAERAASLAAGGLTVVDRLPGSDFVLAVPEGDAAADPGAAVVEVLPVVVQRAMGVPDDPAYRVQWHLPAIDAASAWDVTTGAGTVVAVIDSGVAYETHGAFLQAPDLAGTSFTPGWDFVTGDAHPNDENGHGTHVTGTIAQTTNNGAGAAGVAPGATIMPLRVLDAQGAGTDWNVAQALRFAADHGADVANLSLGSPTPSSVIADAVAYARGRGVTVVAASGNDGAASVSYPAAHEGVIAVGAVRLDRTRPAYSSYGTALDLVAPGGDLSVDQDGDGWGDGILQQTFRGTPTSFCLCFFQGTSMAAPSVSAVAALVIAQGVTGPDAVESVLRGSAVDLGPPGRDDAHGHGLVQAGAAVRAATGPPTGGGVVTEPSDPAPTGGSGADGSTTATEPRGITNACPTGTTPPPPFADVVDSVHRASIGCVAWWEVAHGVSADHFAPTASVTRAQMASFIARTLEAAGAQLPAAPVDAFPDDEGSSHELRIDQLAAVGVVRGRTDGSFGPQSVVTRAEMATFLVRAHDLVAVAPMPSGSNRFLDDDASVHAPSIDKVAAAGLAAGTGPGTFGPSQPVARGQMATFLARTLDLFVATGVTAAR